jgi:hypothetical protein
MENTAVCPFVCKTFVSSGIGNFCKGSCQTRVTFVKVV